MRKKNKIKIIFLLVILAIFLLIWIIIDFTVIPNIYGEDVSFFNLLFTDPQKILNTLDDSDAILSGVAMASGRIISLVMKIWMIGFIFVLFLLGREFHMISKTGNVTGNCSSIKPYLIVQNVNAKLEQLVDFEHSKESKKLIYSLKCLEERLTVESDFGYGDAKVIECETDVIHQLQYLSDSVLNINEGNFNENVSDLRIIILNINSLLQKRSELKKY